MDGNELTYHITYRYSYKVSEQMRGWMSRVEKLTEVADCRSNYRNFNFITKVIFEK